MERQVSLIAAGQASQQEIVTANLALFYEKYTLFAARIAEVRLALGFLNAAAFTQRQCPR